MAKRFTDSEKWKDPWFDGLTNDQKLVWLYLLDNCDHAGLWKKNIRLLRILTNTNLVEEEIKSFLNDRIIQIEDKWFIPKFITFQYGDNFQNSRQKSVQSAIELLRKYNLIKENEKGILTLSIPLPNPKLRVMDMDMEMNMVMDVKMKTEVDTEVDTEEEFDINKLSDEELIQYIDNIKKNK
jgi:hypothetical protein